MNGAKSKKTKEIMKFAGIISDDEAKILQKTVLRVRKNFKTRI